MASQRLEYLFRQCIIRANTEDEWEELLGLMQLTENEKRVRELIRQSVPAGNELRVDAAAAESILQAIFQAEEVPLPAKRQRSSIGWLSYAAVVLILMTLTASLYFINNEKRDAIYGTKKVQNGNDVQPGSNKAVLTLADGSKVTLDSMGNQVIKQKGAAIHQHNGQLQYITQRIAAETGYNILTTPRGGQFRVTLPDGTEVWLNSASSLRYPTRFTEKDRVVQLQGEGYFEVAENVNMPFKVIVRPGGAQSSDNGMVVEVLGTHFNIMAYPDEKMINTTLLEGAVKVTSGSKTGLLHPGQQAVLQSIENTISIRKADVNREIAWKSGLFVFHNADLGVIMREIARWYDVEIIDQTKHNDELYGGCISRKQKLSDVLKLLETGGNNHFRIEGRKVILLSQ